jgi:translin
MATKIIDTKKFDGMRIELDKFDLQREKVILLSRDVIKVSKLIIYAVQRDSFNEAEKHLLKIKELIKKLPEESYDTGMRSVAMQEYVEALTFYYIITQSKLVPKEELGVISTDYLLGLCDLTGELMRKSVNYVIKDKFQEAERLKDIVDEIYHQFLKLNLRNGELRKKSDQIKWNLEKMSNMMYDLKVKRGNISDLN